MAPAVPTEFKINTPVPFIKAIADIHRDVLSFQVSYHNAISMVVSQWEITNK